MTLMRTTQVNPAEGPFAMLSGKGDSKKTPSNTMPPLWVVSNEACHPQPFCSLCALPARFAVLTPWLPHAARTHMRGAAGDKTPDGSGSGCPQRKEPPLSRWFPPVNQRQNGHCIQKKRHLVRSWGLPSRPRTKHDHLPGRPCLGLFTTV